MSLLFPYTRPSLCLLKAKYDPSPCSEIWLGAKAFNPTTQEAEAGGLKVQGLPALQSKFKASLRQLTGILSPKLILRRAEEAGHGGSCV